MKKIFILLFINTCLANDMLYNYKADLIKVVDGDTIVCDIDLGFNTVLKNVTLRLLYIDAFESKKTNKAKQQAIENNITVEQVVSNASKTASYLKKRLSEANTIIVNTVSQDSFGRWLAVVYIVENDKTISINQELLENNLVLPYKL